MTTNSQYHWREYKRKDYGPLKEYKLTHKPKYHEYKSYHEYGKVKEYNKIRNYEHREYKPKRLNYTGYRPEARPDRQKQALLPKREKEYNRMRWFRQLKHCYKLPMGPEYPVRDYKLREYKRKREKLDYHEYKGYKPFKGYPEYNGSVYYKLTPLNYYGFRRGKRVYRPLTPDPYPISPIVEPVFPQQTLIKPTEQFIQPEPQTYKPLEPAPEIADPQQILILPVQTTPVVKPREEYKQTIRDDNGIYRLKHPVEYHPYDSYHEYDKSYRPYQYKPYNHMFLYTAKDSPDQKPHIVRTDKATKGIYYHPVEPNKVAPVQQPKPLKPLMANEPRLPQQVLIMPTDKPPKPRKKIPKQREPVYPQQTLIKPRTPIPVMVADKEPETVVQREEVQAVHRAPVRRIVAPIILHEEESQILVAPVAPKPQRYIPTKQQYREPESVIVTAPRQVKPLPPIETVHQPIQETPKPVQVATVAVVASAPPAQPKPKYKPTTVQYTEDESQTLIMPQPRQKTPEPVIVPIVATNTNEKSSSPKIIPAPVVVQSEPVQAPVESNKSIQAESKPQNVTPPKPVPVPVEVNQQIQAESKPKTVTPPKPVPVPVGINQQIQAESQPKTVTPPKPVPVPVVKTSHQNTPIVVPVPVVKSQPKQTKPEKPTPAPVPQTQNEPKPVKDPPRNIGPIATIPVFKPTNQTPEKIEDKPKAQTPQKPKYSAQPILPPQPRTQPPSTKPKPEPVESKPESDPEPPKTPPKQRAPIRKPSPPPAPSPPLEIPKQAPPKPKSKASDPALSLSVPSADRNMLGALGSVKRTILMMG